MHASHSPVRTGIRPSILRAAPPRMPGLLVCLLIVGLLAAIAGAGPVSEAGAARYAVAQCGWKVGNDGNWIETANEKFNRSSWCGVPAGSDPWDGVHITSGTKGSTSAVGGTKFARWRWNAPPGTGIVTVNGARWHVLKDNFQHRIGSAAPGGSFKPFAEFSSTNTTRKEFSRAFSPHARAFESRLLCALPSDRFCSVSGTSLAGIRGMTITIEDPAKPSASLEGAFRSGGWLRGVQSFEFTGSDAGSGLRSTETLIDGAVRAATEHTCEVSRIAGQWRGMKMQPCRTAADGSHSFDTSRLSDGPHEVLGCSIDFAGNRGCATPGRLLTDNTAPSAPRNLGVVGGDGWRRSNSFGLEWSNPGQGVASPIAGVRYRVTGPDSYDSGVVAGVADADADAGLEGLADLRVPAAGTYRVTVWLVDAAGNENPVASAAATLRFDDVDPVAFLLYPEKATPELLRATVRDGHSGPAGGAIEYRRQGGDRWRALPTRFGDDGERATLNADFPSDDLAPGRYDIRTTVRDRAGNEATSDRRTNGSRLVLKAPLKEETRLRARLVGTRGSGRSIRIPFGKPARLRGRLTGDGGRGVGGQKIAIVQTPGSGSRSGRVVRLVRTGADGGFGLKLAPGTSRRITVNFAGDQRHSESSAGSLRLGVRGSLSFRAKPSRLKTGQKVRFRGRVRSGPARHPSRGSVIAIRYFERSSGSWRPVLVTRTDRFGRFRASYRFRYITGLAKIRLRATLLPSQDFPYLPANSPPASVRVHG